MLLNQIVDLENQTRLASGLVVRLAIDYAGSASLMRVAKKAPQTEAEFWHELSQDIHAEDTHHPVDILIRTGGEKRLSDFLIFEAAYAELFFYDCYWPDFKSDLLWEVIWAYGNRERRFGGLVQKV